MKASNETAWMSAKINVVITYRRIYQKHITC